MFCWNHIQNDVHWYLKNHAKCTAEELNQFVNAFQQLIHNQVTEAEFEVEWNKLKNTDLFMSKPTIIHYFENSLIPMFKLHAISQLMVECTCWWVTPCIRKEHLISLLQLFGEISGGFMMGSLKQTKHE